MIKQKLIRKNHIPELGIRKIFYDIITHYAFELFINLVIIINTIVMAMRYFNMNSDYAKALETANYVFSGFFNMECVFKLIAL